ncbi:YggT family protein [Roseomonas frigidaquae]|uniref:YggT family protein n=1 Tax=Falsiroseomonas frigidaquae TaxID=487318 RepID=A0ABX1ERE9_9PROT|nr:YggT family protein [Falsiroseomonas frigidaquae]NKE43199.1 YggT family protein [Falsiroseomonas frigidaquae]
MDQPHFILGHLPFWLVTYSLAVVGWTLFGRFLMQFFVAPDSRLYIWRWFRLLTDWAVRAAALLVPRYVQPQWLPLVAAFWVFTVRMGFGIAMFAAGLAPSVAPTAG